MEKFAILTDSSCDLTDEIRNRFGIEYLPGHLTLPDGRTVPQLMEFTEDYPRKEFYNAISKGATYATAPANVAEYTEKFKEYAAKGQAVLCLSISTALSGTYNFTVEAMNAVKKEYPDAEIYCVDTLRYSCLEGLVVVNAALKREEGLSAKETAEWVEANKNRFHSMGWLDDLHFVALKGRMSNAKAFMGTLIGIKPLGDNSSSGLTTIVGKAKGSKAGYKACLEYIKATIENPEEQIVFVATSDREEDTKKYAEMIRETINPKEIIFSYVYPSCGVNIGPGLMCAYYMGKPISDDMKAETDIMTSILEKK